MELRKEWKSENEETIKKKDTCNSQNLTISKKLGQAEMGESYGS